jgi:hypothetical protein
MEKLSALPAGPLAVGLNEYARPARTDVAGVPVIAGELAAMTTGIAAVRAVTKNSCARRTIRFGGPMMSMRSPKCQY